MLKITLVVPTLDQTGAPLPQLDVDTALTTAATCLTDLGAGGWTETQGVGGWLHTSTGEVIREPNTQVWTILGDRDELSPIHRQSVQDWAEYIAEVLNQNAVMVLLEVVQGELLFFSAPTE